MNTLPLVFNDSTFPAETPVVVAVKPIAESRQYRDVVAYEERDANGKSVWNPATRHLFVDPDFDLWCQTSQVVSSTGYGPTLTTRYKHPGKDLIIRTERIPSGHTFLSRYVVEYPLTEDGEAT